MPYESQTTARQLGSNVEGEGRTDREGLCDTDGVRELHDDTLGESGGDEGLGDPSTCVGAGSVDLGPVLAGEGSTTVSTPSTVAVHPSASVEDADNATHESTMILRPVRPASP